MTAASKSLPPIELRVADITVEEHRAIKSLARGDADLGQQQLALAVIVKKLATQDLPYIPGDAAAGVFLAGRTFVGHQIVRLVNAPIKEKPTNGK